MLSVATILHAGTRMGEGRFLRTPKSFDGMCPLLLETIARFQAEIRTMSDQNSKISLSLFPRYIAKWHRIYNLEQNKESGSLEIKRRIPRIEVDYSS